VILGRIYTGPMSDIFCFGDIDTRLSESTISHILGSWHLKQKEKLVHCTVPGTLARVSRYYVL